MGILEPIVCRQNPQTGLVQVVDGERLCAPAGKAGLATAPVVAIPEENQLLKMFLRSIRDACRQVPIV